MTVAELIETLSECDPTAIVQISDYHTGLDKWELRPIMDAIESNGTVHII